MSEVLVELLGLARLLTRTEHAVLTVPPHATLRDVARALAATFPALEGTVVTRDGALGPGTVFSLDGRAVTADLEQTVACAPRLLLLTSMEGGT